MMSDVHPDTVIDVGLLKPACAKSEDGLHCGHWGGGGVAEANGKSGTFDAYCCHCNERCGVKWTEKRVQREGHGPYAFDEDQEHHWPEGWKAYGY